MVSKPQNGLVTQLKIGFELRCHNAGFSAIIA
jgi:hypothetical protein